MADKSRITTIFLTIFLALVFGCDGQEPAQSAESKTESEPVKSEKVNLPKTGKKGQEKKDESPKKTVKIKPWDTGWEPVFSFVDSRFFSHRWEEGLLMDMGHPSGLKYVQGRWHAPWLEGIRKDGRWTGPTKGKQATVRFPLPKLDNPNSGPWRIQLRLFALSSKPRVDVFLNGSEKAYKSLELTTGVQVKSFTVPAKDLKFGAENSIRIHFNKSEKYEGKKTAALVDYFLISPPGVAQVSTDHLPPHDLATDATIGGETKKSLSLGFGNEFQTYLNFPKNSRLRLWVAKQPGSVGNSDLVINLTTDKAGKKKLKAQTISDGDRWFQVEIDLVSYVGQVGRLDFIAKGDGDGGLFLGNPVIVTKGAWKTDIPEDKRPKHILIWMIDSLRADYMPLINSKAVAQMPNISALKGESTNFLETTIQGNTSLPGSATLFTGFYPGLHEIFFETSKVKKKWNLFGEVFQSADWKTGYFSSNGYISTKWGYNQGWDGYKNLIREGKPSDTEYLWPLAWKWLKKNLKHKTFLHINTIDPHVPYDPPKEQLKLYYPGKYKGFVKPRGTGHLTKKLKRLKDNDKKYIKGLYNGEITYNDLWFGNMLENLSEEGIREDTAILIMADHGEELFDRDHLGHGHSIWQELVHTPGIFYYPPLTAPGKTLKTDVEIVDFPPTLMDMAGIAIPEEYQGISLVSLILSDKEPMPRPAFAYHQSYIRSVKVGDWKYIVWSKDDGLYSLDGKWIEGKDVQSKNPVALRYMRDVLSFHLAYDNTWTKRTFGFANNHSSKFAETARDSAW